MVDVSKNHGLVWWQYLVLGSHKYASQIRGETANPSHQFERERPSVNSERDFLDDLVVLVHVTDVAVISVLLPPHSHALRPRIHWWQNQVDFPLKACWGLNIGPPSNILG